MIRRAEEAVATFLGNHGLAAAEASLHVGGFGVRVWKEKRRSSAQKGRFSSLIRGHTKGSANI